MKAEISMKGYPDDTEGFCLIPLALSTLYCLAALLLMAIGTPEVRVALQLAIHFNYRRTSPA